LPSTPESLTEDDLEFLLATNVKATVFANQAAYQHMREHGGAIINLGSSEGVTGNPIAAAYSLTKAAVHGWTRAAARAWGSTGITVNSLAPAVDTPGADRFRAFVGREAWPYVEQKIAEAVVIGGRLGDPVADLGPALVFLASEGAHFITGQLIAVDGGAMMVGA
jgi:NAD(P)-dependent dehydrogenase (short-subunit alcohol dehydrogenase family)